MRTQRRYTEEEKLEIVLMALRNEGSKAELCRQRGISPVSLDAWIKRFLDSGKAGLRSDRQSNANGELEELRKENEQLKKVLAERELDVRILKKITGQMA